MSDTRREWWVAAICLAAAGYFIFIWTDTAQSTQGAFDLYWEYYPNMVYAARQLWRGGAGLLWNPLQSCGQPFFGNSSTALLYPPNWFFFVLPPDAALLAVTAVNLTVGGVGAYFLARELGAQPAAALCGALAFELGNETIDTGTWMPLVNAPNMWLPAALWCVERILKRPSLRLGVALGVTLALAVLDGFPQPVLFGYQVIALRVAWEILTGHARRLPGALSSIALGLILPPLLTAVHFFPGAEMAALSVRDQPLSTAEVVAGGMLTMGDFRQRFGARLQLFNPITVVPFLAALVSPFNRATRRAGIFYAGIGVTYFLLALGTATPLFDLYLALPLGRTFRGPGRFLWVTGLCLSMLTALGVDHLIAREKRGAAWLPACALVAGALGLYFFSPSGLRLSEWLLALALIAAALWIHDRTPRMLAVTAIIAAGLMAFHVRSLPSDSWAMRAPPYRTLLSRSSLLGIGAPIFAWLHQHMTSHERVYIMEEHDQFRLMPKSASLFDFRSVHDYEPAPTRRSAAFQVMMRTGQPMRDVNDFYFQDKLALPLRPLLNLAAGRYVLVDSANERAAAVARTFRFRWQGRNLALYENPEALPRAFFVPRVAIVADPQQLLRQLAHGEQRPTDVALVEEPPPSGFMGDAGAVEAPPVDFSVDQPERVVLRVHAPRHGFVHLADQFFPGWRATVNGQPTPILRGNFLFRLVEVPAGDSVVELRYAPTSVLVGALVSLATVVAAAFVVRRSGRAQLP